MVNILKSNIKEIKQQHGLSAKDIETFANTLAISFQGYPLFEYFCDYKYSIPKMKKFWTVSLKTMADNTFFVSNNENAQSLAIFSPYEKAKISLWKYIKAGGLSMIPKIGIKRTKKMANFEKFAMDIKNKHAKTGCWYLYVFVTMPQFRGQGLGSQIMRPMIEHLDEKKQDCYLETLSTINVEIYKNYGFELKDTVKVPGTNLTLYAMLRKTQTKEGEDE